MGLPAYITNFDELLEMFTKEVDVQLDISSAEKLLNMYFPDIIKLLEQIRDRSKETEGIQKVKGVSSKGEVKTFIPEADVMLTGVTFSQSEFNGNTLDAWSLKISNNGRTVTLLENVYAKDALQHKYFERYYPVPAGYQIIIEPVSQGGSDITYWFDLEYLELS